MKKQIKSMEKEIKSHYVEGFSIRDITEFYGLMYDEVKRYNGILWFDV